MNKNSTIRRFLRLLTGLLLASILTACGGEAQTASPGPPLTTRAGTGPTVPATTGPDGATSPASNPASSPTLAFLSPLPSAAGAGAPPSTPAPVTPGAAPLAGATAPPDPNAAALRDQALQAVRKLATATTSLRYKVLQTGELKSGGSSLDRFQASGEGELQGQAFHQLLTLQLGGQQSRLEYFGRDKELFGRTVELVVWRRLTPLGAGPVPNPSLVEGATNFRDNGSENLSGQVARKLSWQIPAITLLQPGGIENLGVWAATGLTTSFQGDRTSQAQVTLWRDGAGQVLRYSFVANLSSGSDSLSYTATYDYTSFNEASITVTPPPDLPK